MNFRQLEQYYALIDLINKYEAMIEQIENGLSAVRFDEIRTTSCPDPRRVESQIIRREEHAKKLAKLRILAKEQRPAVEATILSATKNSKNKIKAGLVFKMRYISGHSWSEISEITGLNEKGLKKLVIRSLEG